MSEVIRTISSTSVLVFAVASMISAGLSFSVRDVVAPLREPTRVLRAVVANFVLVPLLAAGLARVLALAPAEATGLVLLGASAGAPFVVKLIAIVTSDLALGTSLLVLLVPLTVIAMPIIVPLLAPQASDHGFTPARRGLRHRARREVAHGFVAMVQPAQERL